MAGNGILEVHRTTLHSWYSGSTQDNITLMAGNGILEVHRATLHSWLAMAFWKYTGQHYTHGWQWHTGSTQDNITLMAGNGILKVQRTLLVTHRGAEEYTFQITEVSKIYW